MKRKCPYCGKKISYVSAYASRRKAEYVCGKCGKESRVRIKRRAVPIFAVFALMSLSVLILFVINKLTYNPFGIALVAIPLIVFAIISPAFVRFEPLKKYKKSMEAKKAGKEFSDSLTESDSDIGSVASDIDGKFKINSDVFNKIKAERTAARERVEGDELVSDSAVLAGGRDDSEKIDKNLVHVIDDVSENASTDDAPLKRIHSDSERIVKRHYVSLSEEDGDDDVKPYVRPDKSDGNKYSANRRF